MIQQIHCRDLVIIHEMPNQFISNAIVTADKICRPLIQAKKLQPSDLRINVIEFKSFNSNGIYHQRISGFASFDDMRSYRSWDFPWIQSDGPVIKSSLRQGSKHFRSDATKVIVLNVTAIPRLNGVLSQFKSNHHY